MSTSKSDKYVISLDAVDINLLSTNFLEKYKNISSFGTTNSNNYYEFEIRNVDNDDREGEISYVKCHICNIQVPEPYLRQHHDSFKHSINTNIAVIALDRLKHNTLNIRCYNDNTNPTLHFCPVCVTVIKVKDKIQHERTNAHRNSLIVDKVLNDFYLIYMDNNNESMDDAYSNTNSKDSNNLGSREAVTDEGKNDHYNDVFSYKNQLAPDVGLKDGNFTTKYSKTICDRSGEIGDDGHAKIINDENHKNHDIVELSEEFIQVNKKNKKAKTKNLVEEISSDTLESHKVNDGSYQHTNDIETSNKSKSTAKVNKKNKKQKSKNNDNNTMDSKDPEVKTWNDLEKGVSSSKDGRSVDIAKCLKVLESNGKESDHKIPDETTITYSNRAQVNPRCDICDDNQSDHSLCHYLVESLIDYPKTHTVWKALKILYPHLVIKSGMAYCMVCKVGSWTMDAVIHLCSDEHLDEYKKLVEDNFILCNGYKCICQACNVEIDERMVIRHCEEMTHITKQEKCKRKLNK